MRDPRVCVSFEAVGVALAQSPGGFTFAPACVILLHTHPCVKDLHNMDFKQATDLLSVPIEEVARVVGRKYRTVVAYRQGDRVVPPEVWKKLAAYMRRHSAELAEIAAELEE